MALRRSLPVARSLLPNSAVSQTSTRLLFPGLQRVGSIIEWRDPRRRGDDVLLPTGEAARGAGVRCFGVMDVLQDKIHNRGEKREGDAFKKNMTDLAGFENFNLNDFVKMLDEPLNKWSAKMPWNQRATELVEIKKQKEILANIPENLRENPLLIKETDKIAVADKSNCTLEEIHSVLYKFRELRAMSNWLYERKRRGQPVPESQVELHRYMMDPNGLGISKFMKKKRSKSGKAVYMGF